MDGVSPRRDPKGLERTPLHGRAVSACRLCEENRRQEAEGGYAEGIARDVLPLTARVGWAAVSTRRALLLEELAGGRRGGSTASADGGAFLTVDSGAGHCGIVVN